MAKTIQPDRARPALPDLEIFGDRLRFCLHVLRHLRLDEVRDAMNAILKEAGVEEIGGEWLGRRHRPTNQEYQGGLGEPLHVAALALVLDVPLGWLDPVAAQRFDAHRRAYALLGPRIDELERIEGKRFLPHDRPAA
jgi:hypothetical protein